MVYDQSNIDQQFALKKTFNDENWVIDRDIFFFQIGEASIYNSGMRGGIDDGNHQISWDIHYQHAAQSVYQFPGIFYHLPFPKTKVVAPNWNILLNGTLEIDGQKINLNNLPGTQMHLYGSGYSEKWSWGHCNTFANQPGAAFEFLSGQIKIRNRLSPPMTVALLQVEGKMYYFNQIRKMFSNRAKYDVEGCVLEAYLGNLKLTADIKTHTEAMMAITYTDVDGSQLYCHHDEFADFEIKLWQKEKGSWKCLHELTSQNEGALEVALRKLDEDVKLYM